MRYRYLDLLTGLAVAVLLTSNVAALKVIQLGGVITDGGTFLFPLSYIFSDVLTEVYGYRRARWVIWIGFASMIILNATLALAVALPPEKNWNSQVGQEAFQRVLGLSPRVALAGLVAYFWGEFANSFVLSRMKIWTRGRALWARTIGSTLVGELVDTLLFCVIAFAQVLPAEAILNCTLTTYLCKVGIEVLLTPVTYGVVAFLKRTEGEDYYDRNTDFNPFRLWER